ncbi:MAG TPA: GxxExxY protein [Acidobacteriaceae bacterium]|nr:GxxExxY protein [Acidobacteriaceae bacterium]
MNEERINQLGKLALDCAFRVHTALGPGLLESSYKACLAYELAKAGAVVLVEVPVPLVYDGQKIADVGYRLDILLEGEVILETKSVEGISPVHRAQLLSYLRLSSRRLGYVLNFNVVSMRDGIARVVNRL